MVYNPATDFVALWRNSAPNVSKLDMPGLDFVVAALARAGIVSLSVSATAPVVNQAATAWLHAAVPSYSAEGTLNLWNAVSSSYNPATPGLFLDFLQASAGQSGVSFWIVTGAPANTVGSNGDLAIRTDEPGGIYGPKAAGAWPLTPIPGSADVVSSTALDNTFGTAQGTMIYRDATLWKARTIGAPNSILTSVGSVPAWATISALFDAVFGSAQGSILYRDAVVWNDLAPGTAGQVLSSGGAGGNPSWAAKTPEFVSGTVMLFQQSTAPTGWTKQTAVTDVGLRVVSGAVGAGGSAAFSTVFSQTQVGGHALTIAEMPSHAHTYTVGTPASLAPSSGGPGFTTNASTAATSSQGSDQQHTHSVNLALAYVDVIIASKN